ncbi:MAG TPA: cupin domain-containing protein [Azospirillaceae bacterium]|nr:cupin domain-containing protein [Azospirillaceae bacterium]
MLKLSVADALARLRETGERYAVVQSGPIHDIGFYGPRDLDPQKPHVRDEAYIVASGTGRFLCGGEETAFAPGDLLFVPAGVEHRFVDFTPDFGTWVVFFGAAPPKAG